MEAHSPEACGAGPLQAAAAQLSWPSLLGAVFCLIHHASTTIGGDRSHFIFSSKPLSDLQYANVIHQLLGLQLLPIWRPQP